MMMDDLEALLNKLEFRVRQEYNMARYILDSSISAYHWDYYGKAHLADFG